jgi:hypothetical protein
MKLASILQIETGGLIAPCLEIFKSPMSLSICKMTSRSQENIEAVAFKAGRTRLRLSRYFQKPSVIQHRRRFSPPVPSGRKAAKPGFRQAPREFLFRLAKPGWAWRSLRQTSCL